MLKHIVALSACILLASPVLANAADVAAGQAIFAKTCKVCHGATGQGNPAMVKSSKGAMQDLTSKEVQSRTDPQLSKDIAGGTETKKAIKPLSDQQMQDVIAYLRTLAAK